ncbi:metaxin-3-like [Bolinopsis microptera]|uniref:metaxin-3-like n=1 Tax=Bolinopsis microptera TaxID=2820187 RepID=UPI00307A05B3
MELQIWRGDWGLPSIDPQCLAVITYCKMCGFDVPMSACRGDWNGKNLPVLTLAETEEYLTTPQNIIGYLVYKEVQMDEHLSPRETSEITAITSLITESLYTAIMFSLWLEESNYQNVMLPYYRSVFKLPYSFLKAAQMKRFVKCMILARYSLDDNVELPEIAAKVFESSKRCLQILSTKLGNNQFIFGNVPSQLDAYMFAHLSLIRSCPMKSQLKDDLGKLTNLNDYTLRIHKKYYPKLYRLYTPEDMQERITSNQMLQQVASVSAVVVLAAVFIWFRSPNRLLINEQRLREEDVQ